jgi:hypothetical protein
LVVLVAVQLLLTGLYLPPVSKLVLPSLPPQTIISLSVQTAVCWNRAAGTSVMLVAPLQLLLTGLYFPPVFVTPPEKSTAPPQTIISLPVHTAV